MRVFVLTTGRTASTTFARACKHATNFTAAHESRIHRVLPERLDYPDQHIEVDNRLFFYLGLLDELYGQDAFYVHLTRDPAEVARSYRQRWQFRGTLGRGWARMVMLRRKTSPEMADRVSADMVASINAGIRMFLKDKPHQMAVALEDCPGAFLEFWDAIGAEGDRQAAAEEWGVRHNATRQDASGTGPGGRG